MKCKYLINLVVICLLCSNNTMLLAQNQTTDDEVVPKTMVAVPKANSNMNSSDEATQSSEKEPLVETQALQKDDASISKDSKIVSNKRIYLYEGGFKMLKQKDQIVKVFFDHIDRANNILYVVIQDIPFKMRGNKNPLEFRWKGASFTLQWHPPDSGNDKDRLYMISDKPFVDVKYKTRVIKNNLHIQTKTSTNTVSTLDIKNIKIDAMGRMTEFSMLMHPDTSKKDIVEDKHLHVPKVGNQYERSVNGEVLYIFAQDLHGQVHIYYR